MLLPTVGWAVSFPQKTSFLFLFWCPVLTSLTCTSPAFIEYLLSTILPKEISIFHPSCHRQRTLPSCLSGHSLVPLWRCCMGSLPVDRAPTPAHCMLEGEVAQPAGTCFFGADHPEGAVCLRGCGLGRHCSYIREAAPSASPGPSLAISPVVVACF